MKNLKLNKLAQNELSKKEMNNVRGGNTCGCACAHENNSGSSTHDNAYANHASGLRSDGPLELIVSDIEPIIVKPEKLY